MDTLQQLIKDNDNSNVLLMFSGGLDSTGALWQLLQNKENKIHLHHLYLVNQEKRAEAELHSVNNILSYITKIHTIKYSQSYHEYPSYSYLIETTDSIFIKQNFMFDSDIYNFTAASICKCLPSIKKVAVGRTKSDDNQDIEERSIRGTELLKLFVPNVEKIYPVGHLTKNQIYNILPEKLRNMTWSCRTPIITDKDTFIECGKCKTCVELKKIKNQS